MTKLYLVRHGETVDNVNCIIQGQTQGKLTANGIKQAEMLAVEFAGIHLDAIVASDLARAVDTAEVIAIRHSLDVETTAMLRERDWGGFTGRYIPDLEHEVWPDDIETLDNLLKRASEFIEWIKEKHHGETVLAVGHGIINKAIQAVYLGKKMNEVQRMLNAEVRILEL